MPAASGVGEQAARGRGRPGVPPVGKGHFSWHQTTWFSPWAGHCTSPDPRRMEPCRLDPHDGSCYTPPPDTRGRDRGPGEEVGEREGFRGLHLPITQKLCRRENVIFWLLLESVGHRKGQITHGATSGDRSRAGCWPGNALLGLGTFKALAEASGQRAGATAAGETDSSG